MGNLLLKYFKFRSELREKLKSKRVYQQARRSKAQLRNLSDDRQNMSETEGKEEQTVL